MHVLGDVQGDTTSVDFWDSLQVVHNLLGLTTLTPVMGLRTGVTGAASYQPHTLGKWCKAENWGSEEEGFAELFLSRIYFRNQILKLLFNYNPMSEVAFLFLFFQNPVLPKMHLFGFFLN